jgi:ABC-type molybdate transport system substrate-binding protein
MLVSNGEADLFLTYSTNARQAIKEAPSLRLVRLPERLAVGATYGIAVRRDACAQAHAFVDHVLSPAGRDALAWFGFAPP